MKSFLLTIVLFAFANAAFGAVKGGGSSCYVKAGDQFYFGNDLKVGIFNSRLITDDGSVIKLSNKSIQSYMLDSKLYENLPVVCEGNVLCYKMMQYVTTKGGLKLYRYNDYNGSKLKSYYFVFRDGEYHLTVDGNNAATVLPFFGIKNYRVVE